MVIGAGPTGLSAAYHLGEDALLIEQNAAWAAGAGRLNGGLHVRLRRPHHVLERSYVHQMYKMLLGDNIHWQDREAWIYSKNVYTRYPFQGSLYGLPPDVIKECMVGAIEARNGTAAPGSRTACETAVKDCCADGILERPAADERRWRNGGSPRNFEEFIYKVWGRASRSISPSRTTASCGRCR